ncbi:HD superfamily phosphohydrolase [Methanomicrobium sp. W14]|uniref:HD domain-containing protein n=1 Tax=Methanomicrobium sp. W14 TaxID=2817839 RepID=UPI001AEA724D|nr:HD domain-containing protein [Methanomicrobium sp. W14]MBP2132896.1 HD superfamily phosphohydrolase [Methanomicrobium sp. W14]
MKIIKDPVHGYVEVDESIIPLLDSQPVQRLRYVKQLGFSSLVYPGANHTRFEHSLGTMHLARLMSMSLGLSPDDVLLVTVSALLHDIGHGPYSHATESLMQKYLGRSHQEIGDIIKKSSISGELSLLGLSPDDVCSMVTGQHPLSGIIHGDLDVDRMDYLLRDAHYTGVPFGTVDAHRLIRSTTLTENGLVLKENGIHAAESLLIARTLMRPAVYFHHVSRIAEAMVKFAAQKHIEATSTEKLNELLRMNDSEFYMELLKSPCRLTSEMIKDLYSRKLYKRALYTGMDQVRFSSIQRLIDLKDEKSIAKSVCEAAGTGESDVLVDIPPIPSPISIEVSVRNHNNLVSLEKLSPLMATLNETRKSQWRLGIYTKPEYRKAVEQAAYDVLNIEKLTKQDKLVL